MKKKISAASIDKLLPQTQCGLCGYGGCKPYAEAMANEDAAINLCPPGGVSTLIKLGELLNHDPAPYLQDMQQKAKPFMTAKIIEDQCIGCTKCIQACPVDAIIGTAKMMHTIISSECTGCELCIEPCPVDCIELHTLAQATFVPEVSRKRFEYRNARLKRDQHEQAEKHQRAKLTAQSISKQEIINARKAAINASLARVNLKQIVTCPNE